jgi:hypothetical protein
METCVRILIQKHTTPRNFPDILPTNSSSNPIPVSLYYPLYQNLFYRVKQPHYYSSISHCIPQTSPTQLIALPNTQTNQSKSKIQMKRSNTHNTLQTIPEAQTTTKTFVFSFRIYHKKNQNNS